MQNPAKIRGFMARQVNKPTETMRVGVLEESGTEQDYFSGPSPDH